ncbi:hypothetical protein HYALB_00000100 [Hymenoscyphus albidus]|uniref:Uncharacterized protein n=1 Tax=Hymenoscyphus albidus TaxID=595503 RepID=A0A9N9Q3F8_9HELO|nr:hypothetical protein HYALB_00000100 [Hymenoscyphus albidus]
MPSFPFPKLLLYILPYSTSLPNTLFTFYQSLHFPLHPPIKMQFVKSIIALAVLFLTLINGFPLTTSDVSNEETPNGTATVPIQKLPAKATHTPILAKEGDGYWSYHWRPKSPREVAKPTHAPVFAKEGDGYWSYHQREKHGRRATNWEDGDQNNNQSSAEPTPTPE